MAIDYSLLLTLKSMFRDGKYGREHNKHDDVKDFSDNLDIKAKPETKRKTLNVPFEVDVDKQSTDDDDFDK